MELTQCQRAIIKRLADGEHVASIATICDRLIHYPAVQIAEAINSLVANHLARVTVTRHDITMICITRKALESI